MYTTVTLCVQTTQGAELEEEDHWANELQSQMTT